MPRVLITFQTNFFDKIDNPNHLTAVHNKLISLNQSDLALVPVVTTNEQLVLVALHPKTRRVEMFNKASEEQESGEVSNYVLYLMELAAKEEGI